MARGGEGCKGARVLPASLASRLARWRAATPRRLVGIGAALLAELLLVLLLLTLAPGVPEPRRERRTTFSMTDEPAVPEQEKTPEADEPALAQIERPADAPTPPAPPVPVPIAPPVPVPIVPLSPAQMAQADITPPAPPAPAPAVPRRGVAGPPNVGGGSAFADTPRVSGSGPNGEPLYAAAWYREPYPEELRGYLSTAQGPGWALIACRTVREWRVEDCVKLDESPAGSNIARSVLAAAWQFKVRPPRLGGELRYGEWVRIRIDYDLR